VKVKHMHTKQIKVTLLLQTTTVLAGSIPCVYEYRELKLRLTTLTKVFMEPHRSGDYVCT
jgi:hypothetical protein